MEGVSGAVNEPADSRSSKRDDGDRQEGKQGNRYVRSIPVPEKLHMVQWALPSWSRAHSPSPSAASCRWSIQSHSEQRSNSPPGERRYGGIGRAYTTPAHSGHPISDGRPWGTPSPRSRSGIYSPRLGERFRIPAATWLGITDEPEWTAKEVLQAFPGRPLPIRPERG